MPQTSLVATKAIVFDVFGTLAYIGEKRQPFVQLMRLLRQAGREPCSDDARHIMSNTVGLAGAAQLFKVSLPVAVLATLEQDLSHELATIQLYPEVVKTLTALREAGFKLGLCSNLAAPYAVAVKQLLPFELDAYAWSFEVGAVKPRRRSMRQSVPN